MTWDGATLSEIVKEYLCDIFAYEIDDNALSMSNKDYSDLLKKKHNNSGQSSPDKKAYITTQSKGIEIRFKDGFDKSLLKELGGDNTLEITWSMAARHIRAWKQEKRSERLKEDVAETGNTAAADHKEEKPMAKPVIPIGGFNLSAFTSQNNQLKIMPIDMLVPYHNHKFKLYEGERLNDMVQSVKTKRRFTVTVSF